MAMAEMSTARDTYVHIAGAYPATPLSGDTYEIKMLLMITDSGACEYMRFNNCCGKVVYARIRLSEDKTVRTT